MCLVGSVLILCLWVISQRRFVPTYWKGGGKTAGDPDWAVTKWPTADGVPAGLRRHPEDCGIFPRTDEFGTSTDDLTVDPREFHGYASVEADDDGHVKVQRLLKRGCIKQFESYSELRTFLCEDRVFSKFGIVTKIRGGKVEKRLIWDGKASGISAAASKRERVIQPRLLDTARNTLEMLSRRREAELCVLDFADAFWLLPLWGRAMPLLVGRVSRHCSPVSHKACFRRQMRSSRKCTRIVVGGCKDARNEYLCLIILAWMALGLPLSWRKGLRGATMTWVGGESAIHSAPARLVKVKQDLFEATEALLLDRDLSTLIGKLGNIANLLAVWRPFMAPLYAALYSTERTAALLNCCWTRQIAPELDWFAAYFKATGGFWWNITLSQPTLLTLFWTPHRGVLGGILLSNQMPIEFFHQRSLQRRCCSIWF